MLYIYVITYLNTKRLDLIFASQVYFWMMTCWMVTVTARYGIFCSQVHRDVFEDVDGDGKLDAVSKVKAGKIASGKLRSLHS